MIEYCVYKHTNKENGKVYIGRCKWPNYKDRWSNGNGYKDAPVFWPQIVEYGWDRFDHEILFSGLNAEQADNLEREMIAKYKSNDPAYGYNVCAGGVGFTAHHTEESKKKISNTLKAYTKTEDHRKHISESVKGIKHHSAKNVYQFTKNGVFVKAWDYMNQACNELNIQKANVSACCLGKRQSAGGYKWAYERS